MHEALRSSRLRAAGKDETLGAVRDAQTLIVEGALAPIRDLLEEDVELRRHHAAALEALYDRVAESNAVSRLILRDAIRVVGMLWQVVEERAGDRAVREGRVLPASELEAIKMEQDEYWERRAETVLAEIRERIARGDHI